MIPSGKRLTTREDSTATGWYFANRINANDPRPDQAAQSGPPDCLSSVACGARKSWLVDALKEALGVADPNAVKEQISKFVPADVQKILAANGIRDELVFPVPALLEAKPTLIGYYRLLLGVPQKSFYRGGPYASEEPQG